MTRRSLAVLLLVLLAVPGVAIADTAPADAEKTASVRTFQLRHKDADKAAAMIKALMSAEGSVSIQPGTNSLVVTDRPENLKNIAAAMLAYDAPPQPVQLTVRLITAARVDPAAAAAVADDMKDVAGKLAMLRYNAFQSVGAANVEGREGEQGLVDIGNGYRAEFRFGEYDPATDSLRVTDFKLSRLQNEQLTQLMKTTLNLKVGQMTIMGAARDPESARALMVVFAAKR
ncbi:MAG TPA: secretin N-terminal domain-containing protein [Thermoanaerobaculia bacterium]|nr:secretin N-terminal domain-containing protein [Thermoanaerobaculia bacterium]